MGDRGRSLPAVTTRQPTTRHQPTYTQGNKCTHANVRRKGCCRHSQRCFLNDAQRKIRSVRIRQPTTRQPTTRPPTKTAFKWRALGKEKEGRRAGQKTQAPKTRHAKDSSQWRPGSTAAGVCETHAGEGGTARSPSRGDPPAKKGFWATPPSSLPRTRGQPPPPGYRPGATGVLIPQPRRSETTCVTSPRQSDTRA